MTNSKQELLALIKTKAEKLLCETHPKVCALRDKDYPALEQKVMQLLTASTYAISVQTALAGVETEL